MKILWVKTDFLHPTTRGGQIRTLETLRQLHRWHEVHYLALAEPGQDEGLARASEYAARAWAVPHHVVPKSSPRFLLQLARGLVDPLPVAVRRYASPAMRHQVETLLAQGRYDRLVCDFPFPAPNIPDISRAVLFQHNVETAIWRRLASHASNPAHRVYLHLQARRMARFEGALCRDSGFIIAVSEADADLMRAEFGVTRVGAVSTGVDVEGFAPPPSPPASADLVFVGSMDWMANVDGLEWLVTEVLPRVWAVRPETRMAVVGRNPGPRVHQLAARDGRVVVTGTVDDVRPWLWGAALSLVPLRVGGGTRLKIFEAMAAGTATVSTAVGAEGLPVQDGVHLRIADTPEGFAEACLTLLAQPEQRLALAAEARALVRQRYSWEAVGREFEALLQAAPAAT